MNRGATTDRGATPAIEAAGLGRRFGHFWALRNLSFRVDQGAAVLVVGRNGAGKSTLLRLVLGLDTPDIGVLRVLGHEPRHNVRKLRHHTAALLHDNALYPQLTVREMVLLWQSVAASASPAGELLETVGLASAANRPVSGLSAGMRKRLALCRSLMTDAALVVWDEPLSALDREGREMVLDLWGRLQAARVTLLVSSHEREVFENLATDVLDLDAAMGRS